MSEVISIMNLKWYSNKNRDFFINIKNLTISNIDDINPLYIKIFDLSEKNETLIKEALYRFLKLLDRMYLKNTIYTIIKESLVNAVKANIKRHIFFYKGYDINNDDDYSKIISNFKNDMLENIDKYIQRLREENRYVMLKLYYKNNMIYIEIMNNSPITKIEEERINSRIEKSKQIENMADLFTSGYDNTEGAGMGLGMIMLLLKNEGLGTDAFSIKSDKDLTVARYSLPIDVKKEQTSYKIARKMLDEIDSLPTFDTTVVHIQKLIQSPDSNINMISEEVQKDISLTSNILKLANSAAFGLSYKIEDVEQAIQIIGLRELNNMLYSIGTKRIMENRYKAFEEVWETSTESAFLCSKLAKLKGINREKSNRLSIAGLLHDIGRVIFLSIAEDTVRSVIKIAGMRNESPDLVLEEAVIGVSHNTIGGLIAKKWKFPDSIQKSIEYHHNPYLIDNEEYKDMVYGVYLADRMIEFNQGMENTEQIYKPCLAYYNLDRTTFIKFAVDSKREYIKHYYSRK